MALKVRNHSFPWYRVQYCTYSVHNILLYCGTVLSQYCIQYILYSILYSTVVHTVLCCTTGTLLLCTVQYTVYSIDILYTTESTVPWYYCMQYTVQSTSMYSVLYTMVFSILQYVPLHPNLRVSHLQCCGTVASVYFYGGQLF